jgi:hypothetical protein
VRGVAKNTVTLTLTADVLTAGSGVSLRNAVFHIEAGRLNKQVNLKQTDAAELKLQISTNVLTFKKSAMTPKTVTVTSVPVDAVRSVTVDNTSGIIGWKSEELGPMHYNGTNFTAFTLQPSEGDAMGGTAVITLSITNSTGMTASQTINVVQRDVDYVFETDLPAAGYEAIDMGEKRVYVKAETSWKLGPVQPNPDNMVTLTDTQEHPGTQGLYVPYNFTLAYNPGYTERTAHAAITSSDPDWANTTLPIKQKGTAPLLNILIPTETNPIIDLDEETQLKFETNAGWKFTPQTGYADVVSGQALNGGAAFTTSPDYINAGSADATVKVTPIINLTRKDGSATDTQVVGSDVTGTVKLNTTNHTGYTPAVEKEVTVKRKAVGRWDTPDFTPNPATPIEATESTVRATAHTNMAWFMDFSPATGQTKTHPATAYDAGTGDYLEMTIPANPTLDERTFQVWANKDGGNASSELRQTYTQKSGTLEYAGNTLGAAKIPRAGNTGNFTMSFSGTYTGAFTVVSYSSTIQVGSTDAGTKSAHQVTIGVNDSWNERSISYQYYATGLSNQNIADTHTQLGYSMALVSLSATTIVQTGGNLTVNVTGDYPASTIQAKDAGGTLLASASLSAGTSGSVTLTIPANGTAASRTITIVAVDGTYTQTVATGITQAGSPFPRYGGYEYGVLDAETGQYNPNTPATYTGGWVRTDFSQMSVSDVRDLYLKGKIPYINNSNYTSTMKWLKGDGDIGVASIIEPQMIIYPTGGCRDIYANGFDFSLRKSCFSSQTNTVAISSHDAGCLTGTNTWTMTTLFRRPVN